MKVKIGDKIKIVLNGFEYEDGIKLIEGVSEMKKTFQEVIRDIKTGEIWESATKKITIDNEGYMAIEAKTNYSKVVFSTTEEYEQKRKEYSFAEAMIAFELGKEIESCESDTIFVKSGEGYIIKGVDTNVELVDDDSVFALYEVRGKWYINN